MNSTFTKISGIVHTPTHIHTHTDLRKSVIQHCMTNKEQISENQPRTQVLNIAGFIKHNMVSEIEVEPKIWLAVAATLSL